MACAIPVRLQPGNVRGQGIAIGAVRIAWKETKRAAIAAGVVTVMAVPDGPHDIRR
jgi:hypothetical protein